MAKLMHWAPKCCQSTPKRTNVSCAIWLRSLPMLPKKIGDCINLKWRGAEPIRLRADALWLRSLDEEDRVEHDGLCESNREDCLHQDLGGCARIASHRFRSLHANETYADGGT